MILMNEHKINSRIHIIKELVDGGVIIHEDGREEYLDGQTPPTEKEIEDKKAELKKQYDTEAYSRNRQADYPNWGTQLNKIYDDGVDKWKSEMVDPVKAKWPKDNSGPK